MRAEEIAALQAQEESHWWFRGRRRIVAALIEPLVRSRPPLRVVDLGCGAGVDLERLPLGSALRVGVEPAVRARARARSHGAATAVAGGALLVRGRAEAAPLLEGKFDLALALDVLEHLDDDAAALAEADRLLRAGGHLVVTVPAGPALWSEHDEVLGHRRRYRRGDLARRVAAAGFDIVRLTHFNTLLFPPAAAYRWVRRTGRGILGRGDAAGRAAGAGPVSDTRRLGNTGGALLEAIFAAERWWLRRADFRFGLSLLCVARRREVRPRPG